MKIDPLKIPLFAGSARGALLLASVIALIGLSPQPAMSQASFDGTWSVVIITDAGNCDRAYRYAVRIERGQVIYSGETGIDFTGRVDRSGRVSVTVKYGEQSASGTGRLAGDRGAGTWKGRSATEACSGHWEAERR